MWKRKIHLGWDNRWETMLAAGRWETILTAGHGGPVINHPLGVPPGQGPGLPGLHGGPPPVYILYHIFKILYNTLDALDRFWILSQETVRWPTSRFLSPVHSRKSFWNIQGVFCGSRNMFFSRMLICHCKLLHRFCRKHVLLDVL